MATLPLLLDRSQIDEASWNECVSTSAQRSVYGYSWYLDCVLPAPSWKWIALVDVDEAGTYRAIMPIPLRRKKLLGVTYGWLVHQPFFCQFLAIFSRDVPCDFTPFFGILSQCFRYGSTFSIRQQPTDFTRFDNVQRQSTHTIDLSVSYDSIYQRYTHDRKENLRRAERFGWVITTSTDPEPLLTLFHKNHAHTIPGGVADWAYAILRNLVGELQQRGLAIVRYASYNGRIEAGALFMQEGHRIIYLFNAASEIGRRKNARTLLIDRLIQEKAAIAPLVFDFESPDKPSIRAFYRSFGATEDVFWSVRWSRLNSIEQFLQRMRRQLKKAPGDY